MERFKIIVEGEDRASDAFRRAEQRAEQFFDKVEKEADQATAATRRLDGGVADMGRTLRRVATAGGVAILASKLADLAGDSLRLAVDAAEAGAAFDTTFGPAVGRMSAFVDDFANKAGFTTGRLEQMLAVTGNVVQGIGATESESAALSESMAVLAGDVASFSNAAGGAEAVLAALQSAINGEREALKTYGLAITEAEVQQRALTESGKASVSELSRLEKAQATVAIAYEKAGKAVGDLDRTQDSAANTFRRWNAVIDETKTGLGESLLPVIEDALPSLETLLGTTLAFADAIGPQLAGGIEIGIRSLEGAFETWLRVRSIVFQDAEARSLANAVEAASSVRRGFGQSEDAAIALANALAHLEDRASVTETTMQFLSTSLGANEAETLRALEMYRDWLEATRPDVPTEAVTGWIDDLSAALALEASQARAAAIANGELESVFPGLTDGLDQWVDSVTEANRVMPANAQTVETLGLEYNNLADALLRTVEAHGSVTTALRAEADPIFGLVHAWQTYRDVHANVHADLQVTGDEFFQLLNAELQFQAALESVDESEYERAMQAIRLATGLTTAEIEAQFDLIGTIDGQTFTYTIEQNFRSQDLNDQGTRPTTQTSGGGTGLPGGDFPIFQRGGTTDWPAHEARLAVLHGQETVLSQSSTGDLQAVIAELAAAVRAGRGGGGPAGVSVDVGGITVTAPPGATVEQAATVGAVHAAIEGLMS